MSLVLEHVEDDTACVKELRRVLKEGGCAVILTVAPLWERMAALMGIKKADHFRNYGYKSLKSLLEQAGLKVKYSMPLPFPLFYRLTIAEKW